MLACSSQVHSRNTHYSVGVEYIEVNTNRVVAKLPITEKITQPLGLLHGGISVCFAESLASVGSQLFVDSDSFCLGLEINANHVSSGQVGDTVIGVATPLSIGKRAQVWDVSFRATICMLPDALNNLMPTMS